MSFDPVSLAIGLALTAGGSLMQANSASKAASQRSSAARAQAARNEEFRKKNTGVFNANLDQFRDGRAMDDMDTAKADLTAALSNVAPQGGASVIPGRVSAATQEALQKSQGEGKVKTDQRAGALADLRSLGDLLFNSKIGVNRGNLDIKGNALKTRSSNAALPYELDAANQANKSLVGDLLVAGGQGVAGSNFDWGKLLGGGMPGLPTNIVPAGFGAAL